MRVLTSYNTTKVKGIFKKKKVTSLLHMDYAAVIKVLAQLSAIISNGFF